VLALLAPARFEAWLATLGVGLSGARGFGAMLASIGGGAGAGVGSSCAWANAAGAATCAQQAVNLLGVSLAAAGVRNLNDAFAGSHLRGLVIELGTFSVLGIVVSEGRWPTLFGVAGLLCLVAVWAMGEEASRPEAAAPRGVASGGAGGAGVGGGGGGVNIDGEIDIDGRNGTDGSEGAASDGDGGSGGGVRRRLGAPLSRSPALVASSGAGRR